MRETVVNAKTAFIIHPLKAFQNFTNGKEDKQGKKN